MGKDVADSLSERCCFKHKDLLGSISSDKILLRSACDPRIHKFLLCVLTSSSSGEGTGRSNSPLKDVSLSGCKTFLDHRIDHLSTYENFIQVSADQALEGAVASVQEPPAAVFA